MSLSAILRYSASEVKHWLQTDFEEINSHPVSVKEAGQVANQAIYQSLQEAQQIFNPPAAAPAAYAPAPSVCPQPSLVASFGASMTRGMSQQCVGPCMRTMGCRFATGWFVDGPSRP